MAKNGPQGADTWLNIAVGANGPAGPTAIMHNVANPSPSPSPMAIGVAHNGIPVGVNQQGNLVPLSNSMGFTTGPSFLGSISDNALNLSIDDKKTIFIKQIKKMLSDDTDHESVLELVDEAYKQHIVESVVDS